MYQFNKEKVLNDYKKIYLQCDSAEKIAYELAQRHISAIYMIGCGGAYTKFMSIRSLLIKYLHIPIQVIDPKEFIYTTLKHIDQDALIFLGTKTGVTEEILEVSKLIKDKGLCTVGFVGDENTPFENNVDYKLYSVSTDVHIILLHILLLSYLNEKGYIDYYNDFKQNMEFFGDDLVEAISCNLQKAKKHVELAVHKDFQMWVTSGNLWGEINCFCKYMMEEVQWKNAQAVHSGEFFHGPLELVEPEFCINIVINDDSTREMDIRVANFVKQYGRDYTIIDMKDFAFPHVEKRFLPFVYPYVLNIYFDEIAEIYKPLTKKNMGTRRYYRKVKY